MTAEVLGRSLSELARLQFELEVAAGDANLLSVYVHADGTNVFTGARLEDWPGGGRVERSETYVAVAPLAEVEAIPLAGDRPVARAWSSRENELAAECAVETDERFRRRGHGAAATAAWANGILAAGKVPFYSHLAGNVPSQALAAHLGLTHVFSVFAVVSE